MDFLFQRTHWKQFIIFLFGGGLGALLNLGMTYFLTEFFGFWYLTAYSFGVISNIVFNFFFHRAITFQEKSNFKKRIARFFLTSVFIGSGIMLLVYVFTDVLYVIRNSGHRHNEYDKFFYQ